MIATHQEDPTPAEMKKKMKEQMGQMSAQTASTSA
jgi:hypothetical protein